MFGLLNLLGPYKLPAMIAGVMLAISTFFGWLWVHDHNIREEAVKEFNLAQEKLLAEKEAEFAKQKQELLDQATKLRQDATAKQQQIETMNSEIEILIKTKVQGAEDKAHEYFKEVVKQLQRKYGENK